MSQTKSFWYWLHVRDAESSENTPTNELVLRWFLEEPKGHPPKGHREEMKI